MKLCDFEVGLDQPLFLMAGPCVIESEQLALDTAGELQQICKTLNIPFIFNACMCVSSYLARTLFFAVNRSLL